MSSNPDPMDQPHNMDTPEKKAKRIAYRTAEARRLLLHDRTDNQWFEAVIQGGKVGEYVSENWFARCRFAMHRNGELLADNTKWAKYLKELTDWPSMLWAGQLNKDANIRQAKACYGSGRSKMASTTHNADGTITIAPATYAPNRLQGFLEIEIFVWLGVVGGEKPPAVVEEPE